MIDFLDALAVVDMTPIYVAIVWLCAILGVVWIALMHDDPANRDLPHWQLGVRRIGMIMMVGAQLVAVLFGGRQGWAPWPPAVMLAAGMAVYLSGAIMASRRRCKLWRLAQQGASGWSFADR